MGSACITPLFFSEEGPFFPPTPIEGTPLPFSEFGTSLMLPVSSSPDPEDFACVLPLSFPLPLFPRSAAGGPTPSTIFSRSKSLLSPSVRQVLGGKLLLLPPAISPPCPKGSPPYPPPPPDHDRIRHCFYSSKKGFGRSFPSQAAKFPPRRFPANTLRMLRGILGKIGKMCHEWCLLPPLPIAEMPIDFLPVLLSPEGDPRTKPSSPLLLWQSGRATHVQTRKVSGQNAPGRLQVLFFLHLLRTPRITDTPHNTQQHTLTNKIHQT